MNAQDSKAELFDVFLCHNSEDKPAVREISKKLAEKNVKPFLDEADIRPADSWHSIIGMQIETVKAAAVFFGSHGVSRWQSREIIALLNQSDKRGFPVIPVILASDAKPVVVPWSLEGLHWVDFRATDSQPLKRLIWGITGQKPMELADVPTSEKPTTMREVANSRLVAGTGQQAVSGDTILKTRLYPPLAEPPDQKQSSQLEIFRRRVMEYWVDGVLSDSLKNQPPISLRKRKIDRAIDAPWKYQAQLSDSISPASLDDRDLNAIYDATGLLLLLGEPGSGKTTTLLGVARTLLERAGKDIKERVPVVLNLSNWKKRHPLAKWLADELSEKYRVPRKITRLWLENNYLLPLLDGLDEVETTLQPDCLTAINAFIEEFNPSGLVVCCRFNEYRWLPERLKLNGAICLEPLSSEEVSKYLAEGGPKLATLREAVDTDPVLQELAQTPLMLSVMSLACQGAGGKELATQKGDSLEERRKQIFGLYVQQMFQRKGISLVIPNEKIIGSLSWLAGKMREHSQSLFLVEGLQPSWIVTSGEQLAYGSVVIFTFGMILLLILRLLLGLMRGLIGESGAEVLALILGLLLAFAEIGSPSNITLVETINWNWSTFWMMTLVGMLLGLPFGMVLGLPAGLVSGLSAGLICGLICVLGGGLLSGLYYGFAHKVKADKASPNEGIKLSLNNSLVSFLVTLLVVGLNLGLIFGMILGTGSGINAGLGVGLCIGLFIGLRRGGSAVIKHYALRLILWLNGQTPFKFIKFLEHCAKLVLLKKVGGGYIFIHRMLLDYFADIPTRDTSVKGDSSVSGTQK